MILGVNKNYPFLIMLDAIQLATALGVSSEIFLTNDKELKKVKELNVIRINELT